MNSARCLALAIGMSAFSIPAFAAPMVYTTVSSFDAATTGDIVIGWPEFAGSNADLGTNTITKDGVTFQSASGDLTRFDDAYGMPYLGDDDSGALTISTSGSALGLYLGDFFGAQTVTYTFGALTGTLNIPAANNTTFFGLTSDAGPISVTFSNVNEIDVPQFVIETLATPEPSTWILFLGGVGLLSWVMRRRIRI